MSTWFSLFYLIFYFRKRKWVHNNKSHQFSELSTVMHLSLEREHIEMQKKWLIRLSHGCKDSTCDSWELSFSASVDHHQT